MARQIHQAISDETHTYALIETQGSGGGRSWGIFHNLAAIKVPNEDITSIATGKILGNANIKVIEQHEVDVRSNSEKSHYGQVYNRMLAELPGHVEGNVLHDTGLVAHPEADFVATLESIDKINQVSSQRTALTDIAAQHWADPTDALTQRAAEQAIERVNNEGKIVVQPGTFLYSTEYLIENQKSWPRGDEFKSHDFSSSPYWIAFHDRKKDIIGIDGAQHSELHKIVVVDERVATLAQEATHVSTLPQRPDAELASAQQVQAKRQAYGRAL